MNQPAHKTEGVNRVKTVRSYPFVFTGKERDEETGYGYFGARYMDHELTAMWLSVDPMADKYPSISPYAYCAWNPIKLVDPDGRDFDPTMEEYASQVERYCNVQIEVLSGKESLTNEEKDQLSELQSAKEEINKMRDDPSTRYVMQRASFEKKDTKGLTEFYGRGDQQDWIVVSLNDIGLFTEKGGLNMKGLQTLAHELKHCYQYYNKESLFIQPADGGDFNMYKTESLEKAAFRRAAAFGSHERFDAVLYPDHFDGTMDDFILFNPGCTVFKHK